MDNTNCNWLIYYDDAAIDAEIFTDYQTAIKRFLQVRDNWTCTLFVKSIYNNPAEIERSGRFFKKVTSNANKDTLERETHGDGGTSDNSSPSSNV